ncbi:prephenate dehydratase [Litorivicinus lipolyticus]|uniref:prephenate dehydratase n=1 Tax=Litorivicinus lipolyticus TaxID=418701 RepID=UPI003B594C58
MNLDQLRQGIDDVDLQIQRLIERRAELAQQVGRVKKADSSDQPVVFYRPDREALVLREVIDRAQGDLPPKRIARIFREIMSACLALEEPTRIAFLGPEGTFTEAAAQKHFGSAGRPAPQTTIRDVFREVEAGSAHYGVVPVENSTEGVVSHTLDCFINSPLKICGEVEMPIHHNLMAAGAIDVRAITQVFSHQQSLAQCRQWLDANIPQATRTAVTSNAEAARMIAEDMPAGEVWVAIGGDMAAARYDLEFVARRIEDEPDNSTRFLVIGSIEPGPTGDDKTSIIVSLENQPGALYGLLEPFKDRNIDMTRLESRPARMATWAYVFYLDFNGHQQDPEVAALLDDLREQCLELQILGSYPRAVL